MPVPLVPPPANLPPALQPLLPVLKALYDAIGQLQQPDGPTPVYALEEADLPPAADYPNCVVLVSDLNILAHSDGSDWIRQDTGAAI